MLNRKTIIIIVVIVVVHLNLSHDLSPLCYSDQPIKLPNSESSKRTKTKCDCNPPEIDW